MKTDFEIQKILLVKITKTYFLKRFNNNKAAQIGQPYC